MSKKNCQSSEQNSIKFFVCKHHLELLHSKYLVLIRQSENFYVEFDAFDRKIIERKGEFRKESYSEIKEISAKSYNIMSKKILSYMEEKFSAPKSLFDLMNEIESL